MPNSSMSARTSTATCVLVGDVGVDRDRLAAETADDLARPARRLRGADDVGDGHVGPGPGQSESDGLADAGVGAGDETFSALEDPAILGRGYCHGRVSVTAGGRHRRSPAEVSSGSGVSAGSGLGSKASRALPPAGRIRSSCRVRATRPDGLLALGAMLGQAERARQVLRRVDQGDVRKGLREVPDLAAARGGSYSSASRPMSFRRASSRSNSRRASSCRPSRT